MARTPFPSSAVHEVFAEAAFSATERSANWVIRGATTTVLLLLDWETMEPSISSSPSRPMRAAASSAMPSRPHKCSINGTTAPDRSVGGSVSITSSGLGGEFGLATALESLEGLRCVVKGFSTIDNASHRADAERLLPREGTRNASSDGRRDGRYSSNWQAPASSANNSNAATKRGESTEALSAGANSCARVASNAMEAERLSTAIAATSLRMAEAVLKPLPSSQPSSTAFSTADACLRA